MSNVFFLCILFSLSSKAAAPSISGVSQASRGTDSTSITIAKPTGTVEGDLLVAFVVADENPNITTTSGFRHSGSGGIPPHVSRSLWTKYATDSEPASYTFNASNPQQMYAGMFRIPFDGPSNIKIGGWGSSGGTSVPTTAVDPRQVTTQVDDCLVLTFYGADDDDAMVSPPAGYTTIFSGVSGSSSGSCSGGAAYRVAPTPGVYDPGPFTISAPEQYVHMTEAACAYRRIYSSE